MRIRTPNKGYSLKSLKSVLFRWCVYLWMYSLKNSQAFSFKKSFLQLGFRYGGTEWYWEKSPTYIMNVKSHTALSFDAITILNFVFPVSLCHLQSRFSSSVVTHTFPYLLAWFGGLKLHRLRANHPRFPELKNTVSFITRV